jgi:hypothetical protein
VMIGVGLMIAGLLIARRRMLSGWARWITLATGGYVFVILFSRFFGPNVAGRLAIGGWMLALAAVGWAVARADKNGGYWRWCAIPHRPVIVPSFGDRSGLSSSESGSS